MTSARERLIDFYLQHNPAKLCDIDTILESFEGHEDEMFEALEKKYAAAAAAVPEATESAVVETTATAEVRDIRASFEALQMQLARLVQLDLLSKLGSDPQAQEALAVVATFQNMAANFVEDCMPLVEKLTSDPTGRTRGGAQGPSLTAPRIAPAADRVGGDNQTEVFPTDGNVGRGVLTNIISGGGMKSSDVLVLHPGTYYENIRALGNVKLELRPAFPGAIISLLPLDEGLPSITLEQQSSLRLVGILVATSKRVSRATVPLISCIGGSLELDHCQLIGGGGGVVASAKSTVVMSNSAAKGAAFAAVYLKDGAFGTISDCHITSSEVGVRVRDSSFSLVRTTVEACSSDGITCHGAVQGVVDGSSVARCKDNGIMLSPASAVMITGSTITGCSQYGVYAPSGADFALVSTKLTGNALGDCSRAPPALSLLEQSTGR